MSEKKEIKKKETPPEETPVAPDPDSPRAQFQAMADNTAKAF